LNGVVLGLSITNNNVPAKDVALVNIVKQITGPFTARAWAQFDDLSGQRVWQRVFDFGNGPASDNIFCGQSAGSRDFVFEIYQGGASRRVIAPNAIEPGKLTLWRVGVDANGWMWIEKDGELIANRRGFVPRNIKRTRNLVGASNWVGNSNIRGVVLGLRIS
jgi:serralysin